MAKMLMQDFKSKSYMVFIFYFIASGSMFVKFDF
jgi:hypothetical protein